MNIEEMKEKRFQVIESSINGSRFLEVWDSEESGYPPTTKILFASDDKQLADNYAKMSEQGRELVRSIRSYLKPVTGSEKRIYDLRDTFGAGTADVYYVFFEDYTDEAVIKGLGNLLLTPRVESAKAKIEYHHLEYLILRHCMLQKGFTDEDFSVHHLIPFYGD